MRLRKPGPDEIHGLLRSRALAFSYPELGATREMGRARPASLANRYDFDHHEFELGRGVELFHKASEAVRAWQHLAIPWLTFHGVEQPVTQDGTVASLVSVMGLWFLNPCRVVYADFEGRETNGFAYGTLDGHAACGEERFRVRYERASERVYYEITAFSRPALGVVRLGYPLARRIQRRFALGSARALGDAIPRP